MPLFDYLATLSQSGLSLIFYVDGWCGLGLPSFTTFYDSNDVQDPLSDLNQEPLCYVGAHCWLYPSRVTSERFSLVVESNCSSTSIHAASKISIRLL